MTSIILAFTLGFIGVMAFLMMEPGAVTFIIMSVLWMLIIDSVIMGKVPDFDLNIDTSIFSWERVKEIWQKMW